MNPRPAILITGAAKRIGRYMAASFARAGYPVVVHYGSSKAAATDLVDGLRREGCHALALGADLRDSDAVRRLLPQATEALQSPIGVLINNASLFEDDRADTLTPDSFDSHIAVNTRAPLLLTQSFARQPLPAGGLVVNIIDQRVWRLNPTFMSYTLSKSALWTMTQTLAQALAPQGLRVNAIGPGPTLENVHQEDGAFDAEAANVPLGRGPALDEIVAATRFFMDSPSVTGQMIALDGGQHLAWQTPDVDHSGA